MCYFFSFPPFHFSQSTSSLISALKSPTDRKSGAATIANLSRSNRIWSEQCARPRGNSCPPVQTGLICGMFPHSLRRSTVVWWLWSLSLPRRWRARKVFSLNPLQNHIQWKLLLRISQQSFNFFFFFFVTVKYHNYKQCFSKTTKTNDINKYLQPVSVKSLWPPF